MEGIVTEEGVSIDFQHAGIPPFKEYSFSPPLHADLTASAAADGIHPEVQIHRLIPATPLWRWFFRPVLLALSGTAGSALSSGKTNSPFRVCGGLGHVGSQAKGTKFSVAASSR